LTRKLALICGFPATDVRRPRTGRPRTEGICLLARAAGDTDLAETIASLLDQVDAPGDGTA
jgi:hypothetical protein